MTLRMLFRALLLVSAIWTTGQGLLPDLNVTECTTTHLDITLWQTTSSTSAEAACISDNATCVTGERYIPYDDDFNEVIGQLITISLTEKEGRCQNVDEGVCTILIVSTKFDGMKVRTRHVCTLSTSEAVSSTTSSQAAVSLDVSPSTTIPNGPEIESTPMISNTMVVSLPPSIMTPNEPEAESPAVISNTVVVSVTVATGLLLLLCFVAFGGIFLIIYSSCRHPKTRMRGMLPIEHGVLNVGPNVLSGSLNDVISCDSVTVYDETIERELESMGSSTPELNYLNLMKSDDVDNWSYHTECGKDYTPTVKF